MMKALAREIFPACLLRSKSETACRASGQIRSAAADFERRLLHALATVAGARRYFRHVSLIYMDRDADLHTPATTSIRLASTAWWFPILTGRGAAELVRFWGEPPLVREPDIALFGVDRIDPAEEEVLRSSPLRRYMADEVKRRGPAAAAKPPLIASTVKVTSASCISMWM